MLTDGHNNVKKSQTAFRAKDLSRNNAAIYAVGIGKYNPAGLREIVSGPVQDHVFSEIKTEYEVDAAATKLLDKLCA